jgi:LPS sulfotransferase NodH
VDKFCSDMETTPVGVIVGLFQAISQKLPSFSEWETQKHHQLLNSNPDVCNTMTEVRQHVTQHGRTRPSVFRSNHQLTPCRELPSRPVEFQVQPRRL